MGRRTALFLLVAAALVPAATALAQTMYKYRGDDGEWIYTDRKPPEDTQVELRPLESSFVPPSFAVSHDVFGTTIEMVAHNNYHAPIEVRVIFNEIKGVSFPDPDHSLRWVVPARTERTLLTLTVLEQSVAPYVDYQYQFLPGDPSARHVANSDYHAPFSVGASYPVTQAYPDSITHRTRDSMHAVDIAMPIGTDVLAARDGIVFDVTANNFQGGLDALRNGQEANIVRILHDDGTFSLYAHLNWNSIRVKPGDVVTAGQYIADSGNTGFSTGPHLHFAVQRNVGMQVETVPVVFRGANFGSVVPKSGEQLTGHR